MANNENLVPFTSNQSREEAVRNGRKGGINSGKSRRQKADFKKTLNLLLTAEVDLPEWQDMLHALGLEAAVNAAMIREALAGNVKAYEAIARYSGQSDKPEEDIRNRDADTELKQARKQAVTGENETDEALEKLDQILKGVYENAIKQETE